MLKNPGEVKNNIKRERSGTQKYQQSLVEGFLKDIKNKKEHR